MTEVAFRDRRSIFCALDVWMWKDSRRAQGIVRLRGVTEVAFRDRRGTLCTLDVWMWKDSRRTQGIVRLRGVTGVTFRDRRSWLDDWSMIALLRGSPFAFLKDANDVLGAEVADDAMLVRYKEGDSSVTRSKRVRSGTAALVSLQDAVSTALEACGNTHWATDVGFVALATELNLGFIIAGNTWTQTSVVRGSGDTSNKRVCDKSIRMLD